MTTTTSRSGTRDLVYIAVSAALIAICSWISIPLTVPFTLQTFAVFLTVGVLGGRRGTLAVLVYLGLGAVGAPVFAGFTGGLGILASSTGGYLVGFLFGVLAMWGLEKALGRKRWALALSMLAGLAVLYAFGTAWFQFVYIRSTGPVSLLTVLGLCVFPFLLPDLVKLALALALSGRLRRALGLK